MKGKRLKKVIIGIAIFFSVLIIGYGALVYNGIVFIMSYSDK